MKQPIGRRSYFVDEAGDYYLWALQRFFERDEDRYFALLASDFRLIMDLDDQREKPYGRWYSRSDPLDRAKKKPLTS